MPRWGLDCNWSGGFSVSGESQLHKNKNVAQYAASLVGGRMLVVKVINVETSGTWSHVNKPGNPLPHWREHSILRKCLMPVVAGAELTVGPIPQCHELVLAQQYADWMESLAVTAWARSGWPYCVRSTKASIDTPPPVVRPSCNVCGDGTDDAAVARTVS